MTAAPTDGPIRVFRALILTSYDDEEALPSAVMAGSAGYVLKQTRGTALVDGVRRVAAGHLLLDPAVTAQGARAGAGRPQGAGAARSPHGSGTAHTRPPSPKPDPPSDRRASAPGGEDGQDYVSSLLSKLGMERRTKAAAFAARLPGDRRGTAG